MIRLAEAPVFHLEVSVILFSTCFVFNLRRTFSKFPIIYFVELFTTSPLPREGEPEPEADSNLKRRDFPPSPQKAEIICNADAKDKIKNIRERRDAPPAQTTRASVPSNCQKAYSIREGGAQN